MGTARPKVGARINLFSFYLVGLTVAVAATFVFELGLRGLIFGLLASQFSCMCMMAYTLVQTDRKGQAKRAEELTSAAGDGKQKTDLETSLLSD
ncbi:hypothetical protein SAY86_029268 [Trapa natans]|uniref:Uncharacterized protein n=1 Tax=Trapa natans TaxID=22666 RepID=A0AAN7ME77_TRANT|nr:hypothetical protein SAY86_029268 [Trapa natans]